VEAALNSHLAALRRGRVEIGAQSRVWNRLDESEAEGRRRNAERKVVLVGEIGLGDRTGSRSIAASGDHEQIVYAAIRITVGVALKAHDAHRPIGLNEGRDAIRRAEFQRDARLNIHRSATAAHGGMHVTPGTAIEIEARAETIGDIVYLCEN